MNKDIDNLIKQVSLIKEKYDNIRDKDEKFNIFSVLHKPHDERRLHSRFIATLLNPKASHGMGNIFLNSFIETVLDTSVTDFSDVIVYPQEHDKKECRNIDILVIDKKYGKTIIIENKIYAADSNNESGGQLERYYNDIRDEGIVHDLIKVIYLTLDGHKPSKESLGKYKTLENINGKCISYELEINNWLNRCLTEIDDRPLLRDAIKQYQKIINELTNNIMTIEEREDMCNMIAQNSDSMKSTKYLLDNFKNIKYHTISSFWKELKEKIIEKYKIYDTNEQIKEKNIKYITHYNNNTEEYGGIQFWFNSGIIGSVWHMSNEWLYFSFNVAEGDTDNIKKLDKARSYTPIKRHEDGYWWQYFSFEDGDNLWLKDFKYEKTFNLIDKKLRTDTINQIMNQIEDLHDKIIKG